MVFGYFSLLNIIFEIVPVQYIPYGEDIVIGIVVDRRSEVKQQNFMEGYFLCKK